MAQDDNDLLKRVKAIDDRDKILSFGEEMRPHIRALSMRMITLCIYDLEKTHTRPYVFDQRKEWTPDKELAWQNYWDREYWDRELTDRKRQGYNAINWFHATLEYPEWQSWILRFLEFPEARPYSHDDTERVVEHLTWLFQHAKALGFRNYLMTFVIHYSEVFARVHNLPQKRGIRNELTRAYTEAAIAEAFQLYPDLDGLILFLGEALAGERTSYFQEAILPGLSRCGREPHIIIPNWQIPIKTFIKNITQKRLYDNIWLYVHGPNETVTDAKPYPYAVEWAERVGLPTLFSNVPSNMKILPFNSPMFAYQIIKEIKKVENGSGFIYYPQRVREIPPTNYLYEEALAYYSTTADPYSEDRWLDILEKRYGDIEAARHFLKAYDISARIIPETQALIGFAGDITGLELRLPYKFLVGTFPFSGHTRLNKTSPARGIYLVSIDDYVRVCAESPLTHANQDGSDPGKYQSHIWDYGTFDIIPPVHMRRVREMGEQAWEEAQQALGKVIRNQDEALRESKFVKAYMLLTRYFEKKVLAGIAAWLYARANREEDYQQAELLADEALQTHADAMHYMLEELNDEVIALIGRPIGSGGWKLQEIPDHIASEKADREQIAITFGWPASGEARPRPIAIPSEANEAIQFLKQWHPPENEKGS